mgnify:CR=1 FL=1
MFKNENNFINPLLQVGPRSGEKSTGSRFGGPKSNGSEQKLILSFAGKALLCNVLRVIKSRGLQNFVTVLSKKNSCLLKKIFF